MNILVIGTGYVGTTTALVFCEKGHKVTGLDVDEKKIELLRSGRLHFFEPGLTGLLKKHLKKKNLKFTHNGSKAIRENEIIFICVGTPQDQDGSADLSYVRSAAKEIGKNLNAYKLIVDKSTVPVGTAEDVRRWVGESEETPVPFDVVSNPEFLREGAALNDALYPNRIIIGHTGRKALHLMRQLYKPFKCPLVETSPETAEMIKYAANSFLALKISYMNELARLCDVLKVNIDDLAEGIGLDPRIGSAFLKAGIGYGGSCFPKDVSALLKTAAAYKQPLSIMKAAEAVNKTQTDYFLARLESALGTLQSKRIAVLGLSFKPDTDDTRESPSLRIIASLVQAGAAVKVHDPVVNIQPTLRIEQNDSILACLSGADAVILCTDWPAYRSIDWKKIKESMKQPIIADGRNILDPRKMRSAGFRYFSVGRA